MGKGGRGGGGRQSSTEGPPIISVFNNIKSLARGGGEGEGPLVEGPPINSFVNSGSRGGAYQEEIRKTKKQEEVYMIHDLQRNQSIIKKTEK
jgi:hypothetical protein